MQKPKVFLTRKISDKGLNRIQEVFDAEVWPEYAPPPRKVLLEKAKHADALVTMLADKIDNELFAAAPKLKIVAQIAGRLRQHRPYGSHQTRSLRYQHA